MSAAAPEAGPRRVDVAAVRGAGWLAIDQLGSRIVDLAASVALARLLFPDDYGLLAMAATSTAFFQIFANLGLGAAIVQRREVDDEYLSTAFWANLASGALLTALVALSGELLGALLREPRVGLVILFLSFRFVIAAGSATQVAMITRRMDFRALSLRSIAASVVAGLAGVLLAWHHLGVWALVGREIARTVASTLLLYRATGWAPRLRFSWAKFLDLWSFGGPLLLSRLLRYLTGNMDNILIGRYLGSAALGLYAFAYTMFAIPLNDFSAVVHRVLFAALSRLHADGERFKRGFLLATRYVTMVQVPVMTGLALVAPVAIQVVFGRRWAPAAPVVTVLALTTIVGMMTAIAPSGLQAGGRADLQLRRSFLGVLLYLPAFALGLRWGILGVAIGSLAAGLVLLPVDLRYVHETTGATARELLDASTPGLAASLIMTVVVLAGRWLLAGHGLPGVVVLAVLVGTGALAYGAALWVFHRDAVRNLAAVLRDALPHPASRILATIASAS